LLAWYILLYKIDVNHAIVIGQTGINP